MIMKPSLISEPTNFFKFIIIDIDNVDNNIDKYTITIKLFYSTNNIIYYCTSPVYILTLTTIIGQTLGNPLVMTNDAHLHQHYFLSS